MDKQEEQVYAIYYQRFYDFLQRPLEVRIEDMPFTHRLVATVRTSLGIEEVYRQMQGEVWSPNGEVRPLIRSLHLSHTSMSVCDVAWDAGGRYHICSEEGFKLLGVRHRYLMKPSGKTLWLVGAENGNFGDFVICDRPERIPADFKACEAFDWIPLYRLEVLADKLAQTLGVDVFVDIVGAASERSR